jgi:hypothetical protein
VWSLLTYVCIHMERDVRHMQVRCRFAYSNETSNGKRQGDARRATSHRVYPMGETIFCARNYGNWDDAGGSGGRCV